MGQPDPHALTVVLTCKGRLHHLRQSLPRLTAHPGLRCIVVDYACPDRAGDWVRMHHPGVVVVQATEAGAFQIARARNLGAQAADTPWIGFLDADTLVGAGFLHEVCSAMRPGRYLVADPCPHELAGLLLCLRDDFVRLGGYDEVFEGWGSEDRDLAARLTRLGRTRAGLPSQGITVITHGDDERTRYHVIGDRFLSLRINGMYFQIKNDLAQLARVIDLPPEVRRALYQRVRNRVLAQPDATAWLDVTLPGGGDFTQPPGWRLARTIRYSFEPTAPATAP